MQRRKDNKGRVLKDGEVYRKSDGLYMYRWTAKNGKRHTIYDATLEGLREKEEKIQHDLADGIRIPECSLTLNDLFELWRKNKVGLKEHTFANYVYMYNRFVRDEIGMMKLKDIRKSDIRSYYNGIVRNGKMALNTLETIQNVLHQVFAVAVDDEYIRVNPTDGVLTAIKAAHQYETPKRHALTPAAGVSEFHQENAEIPALAPDVHLHAGYRMPYLGNGWPVLERHRLREWVYHHPAQSGVP